MAKTKTAVLATNGGKKKPVKGKPQQAADIKKYKALQEAIRQHLEMIDNALTHYYETNPHFPRDHAHFVKWTVERTGKHARVDVFFKENKLPRQKGKFESVMSEMVLSSNGHSSPVPAPSIHTLDETGAPPTGPKEPSKPKSGTVESGG